MSLLNVNKASFFYRLLSFQLLILLLFYSGINFLFYIFVSRFVTDYSKDLLTLIVSSNVEHLDEMFGSINNSGRVLAELISKNKLTQAEYEEYVTFLLNHNKDIHAISFAAEEPDFALESCIIYYDASGKLQKQKQQNYFSRSWYQVARLKKMSHWGRPWFDDLGSKSQVFSNSIPILHNDDVLGVLRLDCKAQKDSSPIRLFHSDDFGYMFALSRSGTFVSHPADSLVMNYSIFDLAEEYQDTVLRKIGQQMLAGESGIVKMGKGSYFINQWICFSSLNSNNWPIGVVVDDDILFSGLKDLQHFLMIISLLGIISIWMVAYWRTKKMSLPLKEIANSAKQIGAGNFETPTMASGGIYEIDLLNDAFDVMKQSLKEYVANLQRLSTEKDQVQAEILYASKLQQSLIPENDSLQQMQSSITFSGILKPAGDMGGDHYDVFMINKKLLCFMIADVMGKGIGAALTMSMVSTFIRLATQHQSSAADILYSLNQFLCERKLEKSMVTVILGMIDLSSGVLTYSNCGHIPWYQRKADQQLIKHEQTQATALGLFPSITIEEKTIHLQPKDQLIFMTDGVTEATDAKGRLLGSTGVESVLKSLQNPSSQMIINTLMKEVDSFNASDGTRDDTSILVLQYMHPLIKI